MCGIAGMFRVGGGITRADEQTVRSMTLALVHRGPDDSGEFCDGYAAFGHRRLSIIDRSALGRQPMSNENGSVWITFNGEIYNYRELVTQLSNHCFRSHCDTEVLIHGYEEWGMDGLLKRARGMFAFALYDSRSDAPRCFLVRDRLGIKPLYYAANAERLAFASEVQALTASRAVSGDKDPRALAGLMLFGSVPAPRTVLREVSCLLPGSYLLTDRSGSRIRHYWDLDAFAKTASSAGDGGRELGEQLQSAVTSHLIADVPVGIYLSGGVDSAALVALASRTRSGLITLTVASDGEEFSEHKEARRIADNYGADHRQMQLTSQDFMNEVPNVLRAMDQPTTDGVNSYFVARAAKQAGLTVALSGLGGDELFGGYRHHRWLMDRRRSIRAFSKLPKIFRRAVVQAGAGYGRLSGREKFMRLSNLGNRVSGSELYLAVRGFFAQRQICDLLGMGEQELNETAQECFGFLPAASRDGSESRVFRYIEYKRYLHDQLLRDTDVFSMAHSIEVRVPYLDHLLLEHVARMPRDQELEGRGAKPRLTRAVDEATVFEAGLRPKRGFLFPFAKWMKIHSQDLKEMALSGGALDRRAIGKLWQQFDNGRLHWSRAWMLSVIGAGK
jgi:asparagine synthase (glutamine-hydrolysing)